MKRKFSKGYELNSKILNGINKLADNVATTLGPKGRNVILFHKEQGVPVITNNCHRLNESDTSKSTKVLIRWCLSY